MNHSNARALPRNTYSLDLSGVAAHVRDTIRAYRTTRTAVRARARAVGSRGHGIAVRMRGGPGQDVLTCHGVTDSWRLR